MTGRVKTRLIGPLSARQAARLQLACIGDASALVHDATRRLHACRKFIFLAPPVGRTTVFRLPHRLRFDPKWTVAKQRGSDLGARMRNAITLLLQSGARKAVIIGTDTPWMGAQHIVRAVRLLEGADVVLGPTEDGGYYLVGARRVVRQMFKGIPWGTSRVFARTIRALKKAGASYRLLPRDFDLDRPTDLERAARLLRIDEHRAPALARLLPKFRIRTREPAKTAGKLDKLSVSRSSRRR